MANSEHLEILKQGVDVWNKWRGDDAELIPDLRGANLTGINLREVNFNKANLQKSDLTKANLTKAYLYGANLRQANLSSAILESTFLMEADLRISILNNAYFRNANMMRANLTRANLSKAWLLEVDLRGAVFSEANLSEANLAWANLLGASLKKANLSKASLEGVNLNWTNLTDVDLNYAKISTTNFGDIDLSSAKGLNNVDFDTPCSISVGTIYLSQGKIPEGFMRKAGIPDNFIEYMNSLTEKALEYYSCFISYSSKDQDFAERLYSDLQNKAVRCWFAPEDMKIGDRIRQIIDQSIRIHDKLLLILSENSINSEWVEDECEAAYEEERKREKIVLYPVRIDDAIMDTGQAWAAKLRRSRHIGDFSRWKDHDFYQKAFGRLLRDLKAES